MKETRSRARSKRSRFRRARYRRRRLLAVFVLSCLFFGIGTQAAVLLKGEGADSAGAVETARITRFRTRRIRGITRAGRFWHDPGGREPRPAHKTTKAWQHPAAGSRPTRPGTSQPARFLPRLEERPGEKRRRPRSQTRSGQNSGSQRSRAGLGRAARRARPRCRPEAQLG